MEETFLIQLTLIIALGIGSQWLSAKLRLPSIVFLLGFGFLFGPVFQFIDPDRLFGELLPALISLSVAVILFEGGMGLRLKELRNIGRAVWSLTTLGVVLAWVGTTAAANFILNFNFGFAALLGAILVVTGPTVIGPLMRQVRPKGHVRDVIKWEGIVNDPTGVILAVLIFEVAFAGTFQAATESVLIGGLKVLFFAGLFGAISAFSLSYLLKRYSIPDALHQVVTLLFVVLTYVVPHLVFVESGLFAVTVMGIILGNQKNIHIKHIAKFHQNLRVLIISFLFIVLAGRLELSDFEFISKGSLLFIIVLIFIIRPVTVFLSTAFTELTFRERVLKEKQLRGE